MASSATVVDGAPVTQAMEAWTLPQSITPSPKSPPTYPDSCGRHRLQVGVQSLNREIGFLEEELHALSDLQPASSCCKVVNDFVGTNPDPLLPNDRTKHESNGWRWLGAKLCTVFSWICRSRCPCKMPKNLCCCCCCSCKAPRSGSCCSCETPSNSGCCSRAPPSTCSCCSCSLHPNCRSCCRPCCRWGILSSCKTPCTCPIPCCSCPECRCGCAGSCSFRTVACLCPRCRRPCCISHCLCP